MPDADDGSPRRLLLLSLALALVVTASFGVFLPWLGFYGDDWEIIGNLIRSTDQSLWGLIAAYHRATGTYFHLRPVDLVYFPAVYWLSGVTPWKYQLVYLLLDAAAAVAVFHALRLATRDLRLSLLTACLFASYPSHAATHHCFLGPYTPAMAAFAAALWLHMVWVDRGDRRALWGCLFCFAFADLLYEAVLPLVLLMPILGSLRRMDPGRPLKNLLRTAANQSIPGCILAALLCVYFVMIQRLHPGTISRKLVFEPAFALKVLGRGFECSFTGLADLFRHSARLALHNLSPLLWLAAALGAAALTAFLARLPGRERLPAETGRLWLWGAVLALFAAYAPYTVSGDRYLPHTFDVQNRLNGAASLPAAMIVAWGLERFGDRPRKAVLAVLLFAFTLINWETGWEWTRSWSVQQQVLSGVSGQLDGIGGGPAVVFLEGTPLQLDSAPVFNIGRFFDQALKTSTRRLDIDGCLSGEGPECHRSLPPGTTRFVYRLAVGRLEPFDVTDRPVRTPSLRARR